MNSVYEVQKLLMKYGSVIYTGNRIGDLRLMDTELDELFKYQMINNDEFTQAKLLLKKEITRLNRGKR